MAFVRYRGKTKLMHFPKNSTDVQLRDGQLVGLTVQGVLTPVIGDTVVKVLGVCRQNVATIDSTADVAVEVDVEKAVEWIATVDSDGTAANSDVGRFVRVDTGGTGAQDTSSGLSVDINDCIVTNFCITKVLDTGTDKVIGFISRSLFNGRPNPGDTTDTSP